jgi:hypothetical protein
VPTQKASGPSATPNQANPRTAKEGSADTKQPKRSPPTRYLARFEDSVQIKQGQETDVTADVMEVEFLAEQASAATGGSRGGEDDGRGKKPTTSALSGAETTPGASMTVQPVDVFWKGKLRVVPVQENQGSGDDGGQTALRMRGLVKEIRIAAQGSDIQCAALDYTKHKQGSDLLVLAGSQKFALVIKDRQEALSGRGTTVTATSATFSQAQGKSMGVLRGAGSVVQHDAGGEAGDLVARWSESCTLHFFEQSGQNLEIEQADLLGGVLVDHPRVKMQAKELSLGFNPRAKDVQKGHDQDALRQITARGEVRCVLMDKGEQRHVDCDNLELLTRAGQAYRYTVVADGNVHSYDRVNDLWAGRAVLLLKGPVGSSQIDRMELQQMAAQGAVRFQGKDQRGKQTMAALADTLTIAPYGGKSLVSLRGSPANVANEANKISGELICFVSGGDVFWVEGTGKLRVEAAPGAQNEVRMLDASWRDGLVADMRSTAWSRLQGMLRGPAGGQGADLAGGPAIYITGGVKATTTEEGGAVEEVVTAQRVGIRLVDVGGKSDGDRPGPGPVAGAEPIKLAEGRFATITFQDNASLHWQRQERQKVVQQLYVQGPLIRYEMVEGEKGGSNSTGRLTVMAWMRRPGRMLVEDYRDKEANPAPRQTELLGRTAFEWRRQLVLDEAKGELLIEGDVLIVHQAQTQEESSLELKGQKVMAQFATVGGGNASQGGPRMQLGRLRAENDLTFVAKDLQFTAQHVEYDPATGYLVARGEPGDRAELVRENNPSKQSFEKLILDVRTMEIKSIEKGLLIR